MALTFADTHNMIAYLNKSDASEGFEQILDFLNASVIQYALTINFTIYVSCIKQFWSSILVKKVNDVIRLQALIDRHKVIITEDTVRQALHLDDAESIDCLPNEEIFAELARMGYEKPSTKLTFYKVFFSTQWKFLIHYSLSLVRNVDSSSKFYMYLRFLQLMIAAQVGDLSSHTTKYTSHALTQKVFANMRRVGKGFFGVDTPLFEGMLVPQQAANDVANVAADDVVDDVDDEDAAEPTPSSPTPTITPPPPQELLPSTSHDKIAQALEITKLNQRVRRLEKKNKLKVSGLRRLKKIGTAQRVESSADTVMDNQVNASKQGGIIAEIDANEDAILEEVDAKKDAEVAEKDAADDEPEPTELKEVIEVVTTAKLMTEVVTAAATTITAASSAARRRKGIVIRDPEEPVIPSTIVHSKPKSKDKGKESELNKNINWDDVIKQVKRKEKEENVVLRYQALKRKPQTEAQARKNMMHFNSVVGFLEKSEKELEEEASRALKRKLKATPLALKVLVLDYQIHTENNKPYYKVIRADGTHQLLLSFLSILRNFDREDLEMLWQIVQERFASSKPKNFLDDFLLTTLKAMFEKPDVEAHIWKNQRGIHGLAKVKSWKLLESCGVHIITFTTTQMILLVERRYPLTRFTLDQMLNNVRLEIEEKSKVSLEVLRFVRRHQQEGYRPE
nr:hypothetical protein [Tanacetum cinerariifolium]